METKHLIKKILSLFLFICLILNLNIVPAYAQSVANNTNNAAQYTVLVLDISGSMAGTPLDVMKSAAKKFCATLLQSNNQNQIAIVTYGSSARTETEFSNDLTLIETAIDKISTSGNTDMYEGLGMAGNIFSSASIPNAAVKNIVLFSDGLPNEGQSSSTGHYTSSDSSNYSYANAVYDYAHGLKYNIQTLGFYQKLSGTTLEFAKRFMNDLQNAGYYDIPDAESFEPVFKEAAEDIINPNIPTQLDNNSDTTSNWSVESDLWKLDISGNNSFLTHKLNDTTYLSETCDLKFTLTNKWRPQQQTVLNSQIEEPLYLKNTKLFITVPENVKISNIGTYYPTGQVKGDTTTTYFETGIIAAYGSLAFSISNIVDLRFTFNPTQGAGSYDIKVRATADNADELNKSFTITYKEDSVQSYVTEIRPSDKIVTDKTGDFLYNGNMDMGNFKAEYVYSDSYFKGDSYDYRNLGY